ncbi:MAG: trypsin-like peptidase domain-containing protein [Verrucomicrobia bacterium]|nr:trypsin-like peptidase domain-containing protein [Verrucomicrobiota bacterium]
MAVEKAYRTVVNISTERIVARGYRDPFEDLIYEFYGYRRAPKAYTSYSLGSGVVVEPGGYIVTNQHVVERASKITVTTTDGTKHEGRYINGSAKNDLAVLKIEPKAPLQAIELAADGDLLLGETIIALGDPYGLENTISRGVLSAKNRKATWEGEVVFEDMLQTDAAINPGNSGGPLINLDGKLIGINTAIVAEAQGIGFAIPVKRVRQMLGELLSLEKGKGVWFGAQVTQREGRVEIASVQKGSPAEAASLRTGDVVQQVDGEPVRDVVDFQGRLLRKAAGQTVTVGFARGEKQFKARVQLAAVPKVSGAELAWQKLGLRLQPLTREIADELGVSVGQGVVVVDVDRNGPAWDVGARRGLVVARVGGMDVRGETELAAALAEVATGDSVTLTVYTSVRRGRYVIQNADNVRVKAR